MPFADDADFALECWKNAVGCAFTKAAKTFADWWKSLPEPVRDAFMARYDQVYAIWFDPHLPGGFNILSIKGEGSTAPYRRTNSLPCTSREAGLELQARYGDVADFDANPAKWSKPETAPVRN